MSWIRCRCDAHRKQVDVKQLYNQMPQTVWVSWSPRQTKFSSSCSHSSSFSRSWGQNAVVRASARQRAWAVRTPVEQPSRTRKRCCYGQYVAVCFVSNSPLTHNQHQPFCNPFATLSRIKYERYIFLKKCVRSYIIVDYVSACICIRIVVSWLYNRRSPVIFGVIDSYQYP